MFKINVTYPARAEERLMLDRQTGLQNNQRQSGYHPD